MYCKHCGNQIENDSKFCSFCGTKQELIGQIPQTQQSFSETVVDQNTVVDIDGNVYKTVRIGKMVWMAENLRVSRYRDGYLIPHVENNNEWGELGIGAWCNYDNDITDNSKILYNWYAVNNNRGLAPKGWHVPSDEEWETLITFLGNEEIAIPNKSDTNKTIFSAIVGGYKVDDNSFDYIGTYGDWWSSTGNKAYSAWSSKVYYDDSYVGKSNGVRTHGFSVRCVMDSDVYKEVPKLQKESNSNMAHKLSALEAYNELQANCNFIEQSVKKHLPQQGRINLLIFNLCALISILDENFDKGREDFFNEFIDIIKSNISLDLNISTKETR